MDLQILYNNPQKERKMKRSLIHKKKKNPVAVYRRKKPFENKEKYLELKKAIIARETAKGVSLQTANAIADEEAKAKVLKSLKKPELKKGRVDIPSEKQVLRYIKPLAEQLNKIKQMPRTSQNLKMAAKIEKSIERFRKKIDSLKKRRQKEAENMKKKGYELDTKVLPKDVDKLERKSRAAIKKAKKSIPKKLKQLEKLLKSKDPLRKKKKKVSKKVTKKVTKKKSKSKAASRKKIKKKRNPIIETLSNPIEVLSNPHKKKSASKKKTKKVSKKKGKKVAKKKVAKKVSKKVSKKKTSKKKSGKKMSKVDKAKSKSALDLSHVMPKKKKASKKRKKHGYKKAKALSSAPMKKGKSKGKYKKNPYSLKSNPFGGAMNKIEQISKDYLAHDLAEAGGLIAGGAAIKGVEHLRKKFMPKLSTTVAGIPVIGAFLEKNLDTLLPLTIGIVAHRFVNNDKVQALAKGMIGASVVNVGASLYIQAARMAGAQMDGIVAVPEMDGIVAVPEMGAMKMVGDFQGIGAQSISDADFGAAQGVGLDGGYLQDADFDSGSPVVVPARNPGELNGYDDDVEYSEESEF
jgi:hypothetical protein